MTTGLYVQLSLDRSAYKRYFCAVAKISSAREDLIAAAVELFRERGYEGVGVAELLAKSGAPRGSLYFHFPGGKQQIGAEAIRRFGQETAQRFRALGESDVDLERFVDIVFKTTAKESHDRCYQATCPMAAIASGVGSDDVLLAAAVREAFAAWQAEIEAAARARGLSAENAETFASAFVVALEGAFVLAKAQRSSTPHANAARALTALARALRTH